MEYLIIALMWTGYCLLHSYLISIRFSNRMTGLLKKYYAFYRLAYVMISFVLLVPIFKFKAQLNVTDPVIVAYAFPLSLVQYVLMFGSLLMFFWAFFSYDPLSFFGIRQILGFGKTKKTDPAEKLTKTGLLGIVRHPMYFAVIVFLWSRTFRVSDIVVNSVLTLYIFIGTWLEEKKLVLEFGDQYLKYQDEVPMLIPFTKIRGNGFPFFQKK